MSYKNNLLQEIKFHLGLQILIAVFISIASYVHLPFGSTKGNIIYIVHFLLLHFSLFGFIYFLSFIKGLFKYIFSFLFVTISSLAFWVYTQDLTIGVGLIQAVVETKPDVALDVLNLPFILYILASFIAIVLFFRYNKNYKKSRFKSPLTIAAILGIVCFYVVENYKFDAFKNRLPYSAYFNTIKYFDKPQVKLKEVTKILTTKQDSLEIILVLGESVRADHLQLNGYKRKTTPLLSKQQNLISFRNVYTPFTYTGYSLPQILTNKAISETNKNPFYSLYSVLDKGNFETNWIGNQSIENTYKEIIYSNKNNFLIDETHSFLSFKKAKDLKLLEYFKLDVTPKNSITTLHMIGSHWYYKSRITENFEVFKPTIQSKYLGSLTDEELINSYDNTIVYLDYFLNSLIKKLEKSKKKSILIYISDHGETLGEDGMWLHAQDHVASKNPAMLVWYSNTFQEKYPGKIENLLQKKNDSLTTNFLYHSILDLSGIENFEINFSESIFSKKEVISSSSLLQ